MSPRAEVRGSPSVLESSPPSGRTVTIDCNRISSPTAGVRRMPSRAGSLPTGARLYSLPGTSTATPSSAVAWVVVVPTCVLAGHALAANCAWVHSGVAVTAPTSPGGRWMTKPLRSREGSSTSKCTAKFELAPAWVSAGAAVTPVGLKAPALAGARRARAATTVAPRDSRLSTRGRVSDGARACAGLRRIGAFEGSAVAGCLPRSGGVRCSSRYAGVRAHTPGQGAGRVGRAAVGGGVGGAAAGVGHRAVRGDPSACRRAGCAGCIAASTWLVARCSPARAAGWRRSWPAATARCSAMSARRCTGTSCTTTRRARR